MPFVDTLPSKAQIFDHWKDRLSERGFFIDWGEPSCWACGFHYDAKYDIKRSDASWNKILSCWNKVPLQRCHIVPRSLGGTDTPDNLFLMCRECHDMAPNTDMPELFFEWAKAQSWLGREAAKIKAAMKSFKIEDVEMDSLSQVIGSKAFSAWASDKIGLHRPQSSYAPRSSRLTPATIIGLAVRYRRDELK